MEKSKNRKIPAMPICFVNKSENGDLLTEEEYAKLIDDYTEKQSKKEKRKNKKDNRRQDRRNKKHQKYNRKLK